MTRLFPKDTVTMAELDLIHESGPPATANRVRSGGPIAGKGHRIHWTPAGDTPDSVVIKKPSGVTITLTDGAHRWL